MSTPRSTRRRVAPVAALLGALTLLAATAAPAGADTIGAGEASAYGGTILAGGQEVIPPTPAVSVTLPPGGDASDTVVDIPADPLAVSGTLNAAAAVHPDSDIASQLEQVEQDVAGPYNAAGVALIEGAEVLVNQVAEDVSLVEADVIRAEAAAVCTAGGVQYTANSEIISLQIGGEEVPLNQPLTDILDGLNQGLTDSGLNALVDIQRNVVTELEGGGIAVDALVVTLVSAAGDDPLGQVRLGHAEVRAVACGGDLPECSDDADNDGDSAIDEADPGCHTDGDASNPASYDPNDDDERDVALPGNPGVAAGGPALPATGGDAASTAGIASGMAVAALAAVALRRRFG